MSRSEVEQSDLFKGYGFVEVIGAIVGKSAVRKVLVAGGKHPRMRLLTATVNTALDKTTGPSADASFVLGLVSAGAGAHITIEHNDGRDAGVALGADAVHSIYPFGPGSTNIGDDVFEADEDVIYFASAAAGADLDAALIVAKFEVLGE